MNTEQSQAQSLHWFKSSYSGGAGGECFEIAALPHSVHIRDSEDTGRGALTVSPDAWSAFVDHASRSSLTEKGDS